MAAARCWFHAKALLRWRHPLRGLVDPTLAATSSYGVAVGALAVYGSGTSTGNLTCNSVLHTGVPDRTRGRVFAFYDVV